MQRVVTARHGASKRGFRARKGQTKALFIFVLPPTLGLPLFARASFVEHLPDAAALCDPFVMTSPPSGRRPGSVQVDCSGDSLVCRFAGPHRVLSWAIVGGGFRQANAVAWWLVKASDLRPPVDPALLLRERLHAAGLNDAVGMLTSRRLDAFVDASRSVGALAARCIATVGLSNALRSGDPPGEISMGGTINLLCHLSCSLTDEAMLEAVAMAVEARTVAMLDAAVPSRISGRAASGTGTDCVVVAAPVEGPPLAFVGKHTTAGCLIGQVVEQAIGEGISAWKKERAFREIPPT